MEVDNKRTGSSLKSQCKLTYALNAKGDWNYIDDVSNGKACGCFCPKCKEPLNARNEGKKNQHHFAHSPESNCQGSYETTLHMLAKKIIKEEKKMVLPEYDRRCVFHPEKDYNREEDFGKFSDDYGPYLKMDSYKVHFDDVEIEQRTDSSDLQPDCVGITEKARLAIEIYVTHPVDDEKIKKIKRDCLNCIEIAIPRNFPMDKDELRTLIVENTECKKWINCPKGDAYLLDKEKLYQWKRLNNFMKMHPECICYYKADCDKCNLMFLNLQKRWEGLINNYKGRIHSWAATLTSKSFNEILDSNIRMTGKNWNTQYVLIDRQRYYLYPKNDRFDNSQHKNICNSTYGFFKKMEEIIELYYDGTEDHKKCLHYCAKINYDGVDYVFCDYEKNANKAFF